MSKWRGRGIKSQLVLVSAVVWTAGGGAVWAQDETQLRASDGAAADWFGYAVGLSGDVAVIGAESDDDKGTNSGSAYLFRRNGSTWVQEQKLFGSDEGAYDHFGVTVAIDGNVVIAGAPGHDDVNGFDTGAVYVFRYNGATWVQQQKLLPWDGAAAISFGKSIGISGNFIVVGAYGDDQAGGIDPGAAYVFRWNGSSWVQSQKLFASDAQSADQFGFSVAVSGDVVVIGANLDDDRGNASGGAYVFRHNGTNWSQQQKLLSTTGAAYDKFGTSVAASGEFVLVGSPSDDDNGVNFGSAYLFRFNGSTWAYEAEFHGSDSASNDNFGTSVALSADRVVIGAFQNDPYWVDAGAAYVFRKNGSVWTQETKLVDAAGYAYDYFGHAVAVSGERVLAGAYWTDDNGGDSGSAFVFEPSAGCASNGDCDDANPCTTDSCVAGDCQYANNANTCNDGNTCTTGDRCANGACSGTPMSCNDNNACTNDACSNGSCQYTNNTNTCNDGNSCTTGDRCANGACSGTLMVCNDNNACTNDACSNGLCQYTNNTNTCNDGNSCTTGDRCANGACSGTPMVCNDNNACTNDACSNGLCQYTNNTNTCNDGNACTTADRCTNGACAGTALNCNDGNVCTSDSCSNGVCQYSNNANPCSDGNSCTTADRCANGACSGTPMVCNDNNACTNDSCANGLCQYTNNTVACNDGNACTTADRCTNGACGGTAMNCDDGIACTTDSCAGGTCQHDAGSCDCVTNADCNDNNVCTTDSCLSGVCRNVDNAGPCDDGDACTVDDHCVAGSCSGSPLASCCGDGLCDAGEDPCTCPEDCVATELDCGDGYDDDCDGFIDCDDLDCSRSGDCCRARGEHCATGADCCSGRCLRTYRCR
jgi:hypothetical protein